MEEITYTLNTPFYVVSRRALALEIFPSALLSTESYMRMQTREVNTLYSFCLTFMFCAYWYYLINILSKISPANFYEKGIKTKNECLTASIISLRPVID